MVTPFIEVDGSLIYKSNIGRNLPSGQSFNQKAYKYNSEKSNIGTVVLQNNVPFGTVSDYGFSSDTKYLRIMFSVENENPYFGLKGIV